ncbi:LacI family transcriptional regulator [Paenibacillus sp. 598K]|uniref:LacI family DNA-binding transcriptional regulator n=1 Tax=Paenibacillus sp. 598K TaxID=1117987 RepID=UPI000FF9DC98|nr:LacI family DNA-binding transcriptional regulator [Paenibacillus sp. 598K]GBF75176.1 LacI family transcriptional regulator [Paenibacillus sp. 598K]
MTSTINDVARLAGVSRQTVSRTLNEPDKVNSDTLDKVMRAIRMLDYHPNVTARSLANRTIRSIGLFLPFSADQVRRNLFFSLISNTVCGSCAEHDFVLQLFASAAGEESGELFKRLYFEKRVGGLIITCPSVRTKELIDLLGQEIPFVLIGRPPAGLEAISYVDSDNVTAARIATEHLLQLGHRRVLLLNAPPTMTLAEDLRQGLREAIEAASPRDCSSDEAHATEATTDLTYDSAYEAAFASLAQSSRPTALVAADDLLALAAIRAAAQLGLEVPVDLSIVCIDHNGWGELSTRKLTYIESGSAQLGALAAAHLMSSITNQYRPTLQRVLPVQLVEGQSTAHPRDTFQGVNEK